MKTFRYTAVLLFLVAVTLSACGSSVSDGQGSESSEVDSSDVGENPLGSPRNDLERFYGVYGDPENPGRDFFVTQAKRPQYAEQAPKIPPGYLMIGAMWGDVAPWYMKSVSETTFEQVWVPGGAEGIVAEFELGGAGKVVALHFKTVFDERGRLERTRDLPDEWK